MGVDPIGIYGTGMGKPISRCIWGRKRSNYAWKSCVEVSADHCHSFIVI
jgi:hypothetical protein